MAYYHILMCSLDPCQLHCGIGVVDMSPWGLEFHTETNVPRRLSKRLEAPGKSEAETRRTTVTCRRVTWSGHHRMSEIHELAQKVKWDHHSESHMG